jgi:hypothetical protein
MGDSSRRRRFASVAFCGEQMFAICEEGRLWYYRQSQGACPWVEDSLLPEIEDPAGPADHSRGATEMVATDQKLTEIYPTEYADVNGDGIRILMEPAEETGRACWTVRNSRHVNPRHEFPTPEDAYAAHRAGLLADPLSPAAQTVLTELTQQAFSDVVSRLMEWAAHPCQEGPPSTPPPAPTGDPVVADADLVERVLSRLPWGTDPVFARQAILEDAEWANKEGLYRTMRRLREEADRSSAAPPRPVPQPPAPAGGLVKEVAEEIYDFTGDHVDDNEASAVIRAVADWLDARGDRGSAAELRQEADR